MEPSPPPLELAERETRQRWRGGPPPLPKREGEAPAAIIPAAIAPAVEPLPPPVVATTPPEQPLQVDEQHTPGRIRRWLAVLQSSMGMLASFVLHVALLIGLARWVFLSSTANQELIISARSGNEALELNDLTPVVIEPIAPSDNDVPANLANPSSAASLEMLAEAVAIDHDLLDDLATKTPSSLIGEALDDSERTGNRSGSNGALDDSSFGGMIDYAREHGLDIVIAFDSTGSMGTEITVVKQRIEQIGTSLIRKIPGTRISFCTYKDVSDEYLVRGVALTSDLDKLTEFLAPITANGGGDHEEAVQAGLEYATTKLRYRAEARKVLLIFGDAPPHKADLAKCIAMAAAFHRSEHGIVTTISVRSPEPIPEFQAISKAGGGSSFALQDTTKLMEELVVQVFGAKHRKNAVKFFDLDKPAQQ